MNKIETLENIGGNIEKQPLSHMVGGSVNQAVFLKGNLMLIYWNE